MMSAERKLVVSAAWILTLLGAWSIAQRAAHAEEVQPPRQVRVELKVTGPGIPVLSKLPFVGQLFVNNAKKDSECCEEKLQVVENFERIGVDFEPASRELCAHAETKPCCEKCDVELCPACPTTSQVATAAQASCKTCTQTACPAALSACCKQSQCVAQIAATDDECVAKELCHESPGFVSARVAELMAENTALELALEAKEQMLELQTKMWEQFATLMAEKVQLQAQLDFSEKLLAERKSSLEKIQDLTQQNTRLENMVEMLAVRHEVEQAKLELAQENLRLKARVAELEIARREQKTEVRVTKKPRATESDEKSVQEFTDKISR